MIFRPSSRIYVRKVLSRIMFFDELESVKRFRSYLINHSERLQPFSRFDDDREWVQSASELVWNLYRDDNQLLTPDIRNKLIFNKDYIGTSIASLAGTIGLYCCVVGTLFKFPRLQHKAAICLTLPFGAVLSRTLFMKEFHAQVLDVMIPMVRRESIKGRDRQAENLNQFFWTDFEGMHWRKRFVDSPLGALLRSHVVERSVNEESFNRTMREIFDFEELKSIYVRNPFLPPMDPPQGQAKNTLAHSSHIHKQALHDDYHKYKIAESIASDVLEKQGRRVFDSLVVNLE